MLCLWQCKCLLPGNCHNAYHWCCYSDEDVKVTSSPPLPQNGTGNHEPPSSVPVYHVTFPGTFIEVCYYVTIVAMVMWLWQQVDLAGDAPVFKEGEIYRKNVMEGPHKKGKLLYYIANLDAVKTSQYKVERESGSHSMHTLKDFSFTSSR